LLRCKEILQFEGSRSAHRIPHVGCRPAFPSREQVLASVRPPIGSLGGAVCRRFVAIFDAGRVMTRAADERSAAIDVEELGRLPSGDCSFEPSTASHPTPTSTIRASPASRRPRAVPRRYPIVVKMCPAGPGPGTPGTAGTHRRRIRRPGTQLGAGRSQVQILSPRSEKRSAFAGRFCCQTRCGEFRRGPFGVQFSPQLRCTIASRDDGRARR
jgi:hypothetical protein